MSQVTSPPEIIESISRTVSCQGEGGSLGHPLVYLNMGENNWVECPYCDRRFILKTLDDSQEI
ncbi:MAG: zinc-finger domain-containing protein [Gammaproteobacteria bacterium]|jgi:Uncharacterized protein conserved in bacteria|nr:zinc-finger domain-containing protein [Gammaproteobacteria bacterium]